MSQTTLKLLQLNVWRGYIRRGLLDYLDAAQPDVLFAQEVIGATPAVAPTSPLGFLATHDLLSEKFPYQFMSPEAIIDLPSLMVEDGNAIYSRYELKNQAATYPHGPGPVHTTSLTSDPNNPGRNFQHVTINWNNTELNLINYHGFWSQDPAGAPEAGSALDKLAAYINQLSGPIVLAGDFNLEPTSPHVQRFTKAITLTDLQAHAGLTSTLSRAHAVKNVACDYVFASAELRAKLTTDDVVISDHLPLLVTIEA